MKSFHCVKIIIRSRLQFHPTIRSQSILPTLLCWLSSSFVRLVNLDNSEVIWVPLQTLHPCCRRRRLDFRSWLYWMTTWFEMVKQQQFSMLNSVVSPASSTRLDHHVLIGIINSKSSIANPNTYSHIQFNVESTYYFIRVLRLSSSQQPFQLWCISQYYPSVQLHWRQSNSLNPFQ